MSAGVSSFMAGYLAGDVDEWIYIDIADQHSDSMRFIKDCEKAIGKPIHILKSNDYRCVEDCARAFGSFKRVKTGFAPCTNWLKKRVRKEWEYEHKDYDLTYVWGFDLKEQNRAERTIEANFHSLKIICPKKMYTDCLIGLSISNDLLCTIWVIRIITVSVV